MRYIKWLIIFVLICPQLKGQEVLSQPKAQFIATFPFKIYSGGVMIVRAKFHNTSDTLNFILDTGSGGISLDSATCVQLNVSPVDTDTLVTGIGGKRKVSFVFNKTLHFPGFSVDNLNFHVNNYEVLTSVYGEKIDGIIGYSFLKRYILDIDFDNHSISVYTPGEFNYPKRGATLRPKLNSIPTQTLRIKDKKRQDFDFYFDTGAGLCFLMSEQYASDSAILGKRRKPLATQAEGMLGRVEMRLTVIKEVKIGPYKFRAVPTYLYSDTYNVTGYPKTGGVIGNELLRRFNMVLNYPKGEIHLTPNDFFNEPFDYAYTGMAIYFIDGKVVVEEVVPGSPADRAGIQSGDEIIGVGHNLSNNIQQYKNLLQITNQSVKIIIRRNGQLAHLQLNTGSIL